MQVMFAKDLRNRLIKRQAEQAKLKTLLGHCAITTALHKHVKTLFMISYLARIL